MILFHQRAHLYALLCYFHHRSSRDDAFIGCLLDSGGLVPGPHALSLPFLELRLQSQLKKNKKNPWLYRLFNPLLHCWLHVLWPTFRRNCIAVTMHQLNDMDKTVSKTRSLTFVAWQRLCYLSALSGRWISPHRKRHISFVQRFKSGRRKRLLDRQRLFNSLCLWFQGRLGEYRIWGISFQIFTSSKCFDCKTFFKTLPFKRLPRTNHLKGRASLCRDFEGNANRNANLCCVSSNRDEMWPVCVFDSLLYIPDLGRGFT